ncbi:hypothetical protein OAF54_01090 [bacterium]|nr:hypothetical protein [bacterium]
MANENSSYQEVLAELSEDLAKCCAKFVANTFGPDRCEGYVTVAEEVRGVFTRLHQEVAGPDGMRTKEGAIYFKVMDLERRAVRAEWLLEIIKQHHDASKSDEEFGTEVYMFLNDEGVL